jgi:hypothetical protein
MPEVFRHQGYRFFFFSDEGTPREPVHVHVESGDGKAKFWLRPEVRVAYEKGYNRKTLAQLTWIVRKERERIERKWNDHFG